jgi:catechol 2,3-dioxygenase-like lactoylglutathione lyase family enzyme
MSEGFGLGRIGQISVCVKDVERATKFYRDVLGMRFLFQFPGMAFFDCSGVRLYLARAEKPELDHTSVLYYRVDSIHDAARTLKERGVAFETEPQKLHADERYELWMGFFRDSEGNMLALMSEVPKT